MSSTHHVDPTAGEDETHRRRIAVEWIATDDNVADVPSRGGDELDASTEDQATTELLTAIFDNGVTLLDFSTIPPEVVKGALGMLDPKDKRITDRLLMVTRVAEAVARSTPTPDIVESFCDAYTRFTNAVSGSQKHLFVTPQFRDAFAAMAGRATTRTSNEKVRSALSHATYGYTSELLIPSTRQALLVLATGVSDVESIKAVVRTISEVMHRDRRDRTASFRTAALRDALVALAAKATNGVVVSGISELVYRAVEGDQSSMDAFACKAIRQAFIQMAAYVASDMVAEWWCRAISEIADGDKLKNRDVFATVAMRDAVLLVARHVKTTDGISSLGCVIYHIAIGSNDAGGVLFATAETRDMLLRLAPYATTSDSVKWVVCPIGVLVSLAAHDFTDLFATAKLRDALVSMAPRATTLDAVHPIASTISNLTAEKQQHRDLLATPPVRDALITLMRYATDAETVYWVYGAIGNLSSHPAGNRVFATDRMREALLSGTRYATSEEARSHARKVLRLFGIIAHHPGWY